MITLADVRRQQNPALQMALILTMWDQKKPTYAEWVVLVEGAIDRAMNSLASRRHHYHDLGEDPLTQNICMSLEAGGLDARSAVVNGNCDLTVRYREYSWIGEAKIGDDVNKVYGGYLQLTTRYAQGTPGHTALGMLLYCVNSQAVAALDGWRVALQEQVPNSRPQDVAPPNPLRFRSVDACESSGVELTILHFATPLMFDPQETKKKLSKKARDQSRMAKARAKRASSS